LYIPSKYFLLLNQLLRKQKRKTLGFNLIRFNPSDALLILSPTEQKQLAIHGVEEKLCFKKRELCYSKYASNEQQNNKI